jgi:hypothetical protein
MTSRSTSLSMPTAAATWEAQRDLGALTRDRPLVTQEIFEGNAYYGFDLVLKEYAGLPPEYPLKAVVPHGLTLDPGFVWKEERDAPLPGVLCYEPHRRPLYARACDKLVLPAASPYLYALELLREAPPEQREGTLVFPSHSTHHFETGADMTALADTLLELPEEAGPVRVCMYWRDVELGHDRAFSSRGFEIVTAGHIFDPAFPFRLCHLLARHRHAAGNQLGSHMLYAVASGCDYFHVGELWPRSVDDLLRPSSRVGEVAWVEPDLPRVRELYERMVSAFTRSFGGTDAQDQHALMEYFLGAEHLVAPEELRRTLATLERADRWGHRSSGPHARRVPPARMRRRYRRARASLASRPGLRRRGGP